MERSFKRCILCRRNVRDWTWVQSMIMSMNLQFPFLALVNLGKAWKSLKNRITHQGEGSWVWISLTLRWWWCLWIGSIIKAYQEQQEEVNILASSPFSTIASLPLHLISRREMILKSHVAPFYETRSVIATTTNHGTNTSRSHSKPTIRWIRDSQRDTIGSPPP